MVEARSLPVKTACFPHPVRMSQRGIRTTAQRLCLEVYKDTTFCLSGLQLYGENRGEGGAHEFRRRDAGPLPRCADTAAGAPPARARTLRPRPQPARSPVLVPLAHSSASLPYAEPERAEPACLDSLWQATDAPLDPRDRAPLAGASRCIVLEQRVLQRQYGLRLEL